MKKLLLRSSSFRFLEVASSSILSIILTPFLIHHLGDSNYGLWLLVLATLGWFNFLDLGLSYAVQRGIVFALEKKDEARVNSIFSVAVTLFSILGSVATAFVVILAFFPHLLGVEERLRDTTFYVLIILAFKVLLDFMMNSFHGFFTAYLRMDIDANISLLNKVVKSFLIFILIKDLNIYGAVIATMVSDILSHSLKIFYAKKLNNKFCFKWDLVRFSEVKELFSFSKHLIATGIANSIKRKADPVVIAHVLGLKYVALYGVISNLTSHIEGLVSAIVGVFQPVFTKKVAQQKSIDSSYKNILSLNFVVVVAFYIPLAILAENFILLWIGPEYSDVSILAFALGFAYSCKSISRPVSSLLLAQANHKLLSVVNLFGAMLNIILSIFLANHYGLQGVAVATAISFFFSDVILHLLLIRRYTSLPVLKPFVFFMLATTLYFLLVNVGWAIMANVEISTWFELFLASITCFIFSAIIAIIFLLDNKIKIMIKSYMFKGVA